MQFIPSDHTYATDTAAASVWESLNDILRGVDGIAYYKHPIISSTTRAVPDLTILARGFEPTVVKILAYAIEELTHVTGEVWNVGGEFVDSPLLELEDYSIALNHQFEQTRPLRSLLQTHSVLIFPLVSEAEFIGKFGEEATRPEDSDVTMVFGRNPTSALKSSPRELSDDQWKLAKSVFQGLTPLNRGKGVRPIDTSKIGRAIRVLEREIALLDDEQHKVAVQIAPGPQRIRGLAGTGKTVILAKKAAHLHQRYPQKRILFTFNTQSLYNQAQTLISQFYRQHSDSPPDFENGIHVRHGWGGSARPGVYSDVCGRVGRTPLNFNTARSIDPANPFRAACNHAHQVPVEPYYDFILVDEAQDFPKEFFQLLAKLSTPERRIYWAYDELQTLSATEIPDPAELFGRDAEGNALVSLDGDDYGGVIEKDFVLHKSYRCPRAILMLAHGIGLGIHSRADPGWI